MLVNKSMPAVVALYDAIIRGKKGSQRGPAKILLLDIAYGSACRVLLTMLVGLDEDIHLYLTALLVATLA